MKDIGSCETKIMVGTNPYRESGHGEIEHGEKRNECARPG